MKTPKILLDLPFSEINYLKASANYTIIFDQSNNEHLSAYSLKVFANLLKNQPFIRLDRGTLVRHSFIQKMEGKSTVLLKNNQEITLPRRKLKVLSQKLSQLA